MMQVINSSDYENLPVEYNKFYRPPRDVTIKI